jgi:hypothetical protein
LDACCSRGIDLKRATKEEDCLLQPPAMEFSNANEGQPKTVIRVTRTNPYRTFDCFDGFLGSTGLDRRYAQLRVGRRETG